MAQRIFLSPPHMSDEGYELRYIHEAFAANWIAPAGENLRAFEKAVEEYVGAGYALALNTGTAALRLAMILAGIGPGDRVFCQSLTFAASANPIVQLGAEPVFIDSETDTWNMDPDALRRAIAIYGVPKAIVLVHLYGNPGKMDQIISVCGQYGITLIEDAAEALGSVWQGRRCGAFGDFGVFSFNGNKIITTSGGGMLLCREKEAAERGLKLATQAREPVPWYEHREIGDNLRMSNISAGIGRGQMRVLERRVERRREIFAQYRRELADLPLSFQPSQRSAEPNRWLTALALDPECGVTPEDVLRKLEEENIEARYLWKPLHTQPVFAGAACVTAGEAPVSEDLFRRGLCLPSGSAMTGEQVDRVCGLIRKLF